jgi:hypothetical protein
MQAKGIAAGFAGSFMTLKLDVRSFFGSVVASQESSFINLRHQFVLTLAASIPAEGGGGSSPPATRCRRHSLG